MCMASVYKSVLCVSEVLVCIFSVASSLCFIVHNLRLYLAGSQAVRIVHDCCPVIQLMSQPSCRMYAFRHARSMQLATCLMAHLLHNCCGMGGDMTALMLHVAAHHSRCPLMYTGLCDMAAVMLHVAMHHSRCTLMYTGLCDMTAVMLHVAMHHSRCTLMLCKRSCHLGKPPGL